MTAADKKLQAQDPFWNPFINDIFKPIMAADKLQILRKDRDQYDILLLPKDLKVFNKDKRDSMLADYNQDEDLELLKADAAAEELEVYNFNEEE